MTVLVTCGGGRIGGHLADRLFEGARDVCDA